MKTSTICAGNKGKAYYAHSMRIYGTEREKEELHTICKFGYIPINPNGDVLWGGSMQVYFDCIDTTGCVVVSEYKGHIGRGVFEEVQYALDSNYEVLVLRQDELLPVIGLSTTDTTDWKVRYGRLMV